MNSKKIERVSSVVTCPWCENKVVLQDNICPKCNHEVLPEHLESTKLDIDHPVLVKPITDHANLTIEEVIENNFKCSKCGTKECITKEVAMTGTGLSKIFDIQYNHYLFVSCTNCGFVEIFNPDILRGRTSGQLGSIMDILFG